MREYLKSYIDGPSTEPADLRTVDVENPATQQAYGRIAIGASADVDKAVRAARNAFVRRSQGTREERLDLLQAVGGEYREHTTNL
ncbi:MAG: aldehyde dehydrogenase family protein [Mycobacterium sp.]|nr:aldehyde dehydrogenase family protein [Mycobacterium sp.]